MLIRVYDEAGHEVPSLSHALHAQELGWLARRLQYDDAGDIDGDENDVLASMADHGAAYQDSLSAFC